MACHEIAALRVGLMHLLGINDPVELQHELNELGNAANDPGPLQAMCSPADLHALQRSYESALAQLELRVASLQEGDPIQPYLRSLLVMTKKTELDLSQHLRSLTQFYTDLDEMHHFIHEIYPAE